MDRNKVIAIRLRADEKKLVDDYAKVTSVPTATLVRQIIMREVRLR